MVFLVFVTSIFCLFFYFSVINSLSSSRCLNGRLKTYSCITENTSSITYPSPQSTLIVVILIHAIMVAAVEDVDMEDLGAFVIEDTVENSVKVFIPIQKN